MGTKALDYLLTCVTLHLTLFSVHGFNVNVKNVKVYDGPQKGTYFGYSVAMMRSNGVNWLMVGAPKAVDPEQDPATLGGLIGVRSPGVVYYCPIDGTETWCQQLMIDNTGNIDVVAPGNRRLRHDKDDEWLGVAMDVSPGSDKMAVCAHRWKNARYFRQGFLYMQGLCYETADSGTSFRLVPLLVDNDPSNLIHSEDLYPIWAYGSMGQAVQYSKDGLELVIGAPGLNDWQGYTIATARLMRNNVSYVIAGSPRANLSGTAFVFESKRERVVAQPFYGEQFGSYFGSVICAADVNGDQLDDVIIGAPHFATNRSEEGRVYVYINKGLLRFERQQDTLNGSNSEGARFGSAITNIGDINKDSFFDLAIGAPYENDGEGAIYIYNGYTGGVWPRYSQRISGSDVRSGLKAFGSSFTKQSLQIGESFAVGAYDSGSVALLSVNPVVAMETMMQVRPDRITADEPYIGLNVCFKFTGQAASLPATLGVRYSMDVDTSTPAGKVRALVIPNNVPYISRALSVRQGEFVCDQDVRVYAPYQDIWRDVEVHVRYSLDVNPTCTSGCPVLEGFNGRRPQQAVDRNELRKTDKTIEVRVALFNGKENAYNVIIDVSLFGNYTKELRSYGMEGDPIVDCDLLKFEIEATEVMSNSNTTHRCHVRKPYPLKSQQEVAVLLQFPLDMYVTKREFRATFTVRTEEQTTVEATETLVLPIKSEYGIRIEGASDPEQVTLGVQQESNTWTEVEHRYSVKNLGPSPLENAEILAYVPAIIHRGDQLITNISVWLSDYQSDPPRKARCYETVRDSNVASSESAGGYAISVDCSAFPCKRFSCFMVSFTKDQSLLVSVNMSVSRQILSRLQARDTVRLASRVSIPEVNYGKSLDKEVETMFHKTTNSMERKKLSIPIWLIIVSVVSAFLVLLVIIAILIKIGFFKRAKNEELKRLKSTKRTSSPFKDTVRDHASNGSSDNTRIMSTIEDTDGATAHEHEHAHDNPVANVHDIDTFCGDFHSSEKHDNFLNDLQKATAKNSYS
ncbi:ITA9-like protein [Mya arenaria]|uniref:ITA9-like protein n=1 Tax=Mya arenaria TaxID=6604 RepID=A0ABY7DBR8_MYAAR|nr:ITA9-like protein [Mya arenaria]